jgi:hypothetical protein
VNRNSIRLLGLFLLIPSVFLGLLPYLASHTMLVNGFPSFHWVIGNTTIADFHKDLDGNPIAETSSWVWLPAIVAELLLLGLSLVSPKQVNRFKISIHG